MFEIKNISQNYLKKKKHTYELKFTKCEINI